MSRPPRLQFPGAVYHLTARGNRRLPIFLADTDRREFLRVLARVVRRYAWVCATYCLMDNHYHLLVRTPEPNLADGMRLLNGLYARRFNARHKFQGHVFGDRYHDASVIEDSHLLEAARYVVLNPVRGGLCSAPSDWPWSSYRATVGLEPAPRFLDTGWLLDQFRPELEPAREAYRGFVLDGLGRPPEQENFLEALPIPHAVSVD